MTAAAVAVAWKRAFGLDMAAALTAANAALVAAAKAGDAAGATAALDAGAHVNCVATESLDELLRSTPLHLAAHNGHAAVVALLLARGADVDAEDVGSWTPLHRASEHGHSNVVSQLLECGAYTEARDY